MASGSFGIPHVVQTIEESHEVIAFAGIILGFGDFELHAIGDSGLLGSFTSHVDRARVVIEADKGGFRIRLSHQYSGRAEPAPNVGDARSLFESCLGAA